MDIPDTGVRGDIEAYLAVCEGTRLVPEDWLAVAQMLRKGKKASEALSWVEKELHLGRRRSDGSARGELEDLERGLLKKLGRGEDALQLAWKERERWPDEITYKKLMRYVPRESREAWHAKAIEAASKTAPCYAIPFLTCTFPSGHPTWSETQGNAFVRQAAEFARQNGFRPPSMEGLYADDRTRADDLGVPRPYPLGATCPVQAQAHRSVPRPRRGLACGNAPWTEWGEGGRRGSRSARPPAPGVHRRHGCLFATPVGGHGSCSLPSRSSSMPASTRPSIAPHRVDRVPSLIHDGTSAPHTRDRSWRENRRFGWSSPAPVAKLRTFPCGGLAVDFETDVQLQPGSPQPDLSVSTGRLRVVVQPYVVKRGEETFGLIRLWLDGELTVRTIEVLSRICVDLRRRGARRFLVDGTRLADIDAGGVRWLLDQLDILRLWDGDLRMVNVAGKVRLLLELMEVRAILAPEGKAELAMRQLALAPEAAQT